MPRTELFHHLIKLVRQSLQSHSLPAESPKANPRRKFIKQAGGMAAVAGAAAVLGGCTKGLAALELGNDATTDNANNGYKPVVAVVGAGLAGVYTAWKLQGKCDVTVYEASSRVGGRMFTSAGLMAPGSVTELGGEFVDTVHEDLIGLIQELGLELLDIQSPAEANLTERYIIDGIAYTEAQVLAEFKKYVAAINADSNTLSDVISADSFSPEDRFFDRLSIAGYFGRIGINGWLRKLLELAYLTEYGLPANEQSALNFLLLIGTADTTFEIYGESDERYKVRGGSQQICRKVAEKLKKSVQTGFELVRIGRFPGKFELSFRQTGTGKLVKTWADKVVLAIPFTVLRKIPVLPDWPGWKRKAIQELGYGGNSKLFMGFRQPLWRDQGFSGDYFSNNILQNGWDNTRLQQLQEAGITVFSGGQQAIEVGNGSLAAQVALHLTALDKVFPGVKQQYNGRSGRFIWPTSPYAKASYACFLPGQYTTIAGNEGKPIGQLYFAGEHCSADFQGFMNGALQSAKQTVAAVLRSL